uniref:Uncharacterized protein n=1 Tax=Moorena producens (strain JHB) TaxID=1454205 RepID=A0A1D9G1T0_MOOP1
MLAIGNREQARGKRQEARGNSYAIANSPAKPQHKISITNPTPHSRFPRCAFRRRIKFATGRTAPDSLTDLLQKFKKYAIM